MPDGGGEGEEPCRDAHGDASFGAAFVAFEVEPAPLQMLSETTEMFHFRDRSGHEVDFVLEQTGRLVGLEVKSATSVGHDGRDA